MRRFLMLVAIARRLRQRVDAWRRRGAGRDLVQSFPSERQRRLVHSGEGHGGGWVNPQLLSLFTPVVDALRPWL